jgi:glycine C-acetyltransferase
MMQKNSNSRPTLLPNMIWDIDFFKEQDLYFHQVPIEEIYPDSARIRVPTRHEMLMFGSYSYLGLIGNPKINQAAKEAVEKYGTGANGVRMLAGTLPIHHELEAKIADFKGAEAAITFSSGYVANLSTISSLLRKGDTVICDKLNHASIVDGCMLSRAKFVRFNHNNMSHLERQLSQTDPRHKKLVIVDAVFSMDGDIINLPEVSRLCRKYDAYLMVDEAHSIGVLGKTGHGIEEHFELPPDAVDVKMGTLSKAIPSVGGYVAGSRELIQFLQHEARGFIYSGSLPPASAGAALATLELIEKEPERVEKLRFNYHYFSSKLRQMGFDLLQSETPIMPIICGTLDKASLLTRHCWQRGIFVQQVAAPVVPEGTARLRAAVTANHTIENMDYCLQVLEEGATELQII